MSGGMDLQGRVISDRKFQVDSLDGLRGLAILIVFLSHTSNGGNFLVPSVDLSGIGKSGVFLFFLLSSFLLTVPFIEKGRECLSKQYLAKYFFRRFMRIYPLYSAYLLVGLASSLFIYAVFGKQLGIPFYLSLENFLDQMLLQSGRGVTWSILVESRFYFVLPFVALAFSVLLRNKLFPAIALGSLIIALSNYSWPPSEKMVNDPRLGPYLPIFIMGSLLAVVNYNWRNTWLKSSRSAAALLDVAAVCSLLFMIMLVPAVAERLTGEKFPMGYLSKQHLLLASLWGLVLFSSINGAGVMRFIFEARVLRYLGFISFSFYLLHVVVLGAVRRVATETILDGWVMLALTVVLSHVSWVLIEKPASRLSPTDAMRALRGWGAKVRL